MLRFLRTMVGVGRLTVTPGGHGSEATLVARVSQGRQPRLSSTPCRAYRSESTCTEANQQDRAGAQRPIAVGVDNSAHQAKFPGGQTTPQENQVELARHSSDGGGDPATMVRVCSNWKQVFSLTHKICRLEVLPFVTRVQLVSMVLTLWRQTYPELRQNYSELRKNYPKLRVKRPDWNRTSTSGEP